MVPSYDHTNTFSSSRRKINFSHLLKIVSNSYFKHKVKKPTRKEKFNLYFVQRLCIYFVICLIITTTIIPMTMMIASISKIKEYLS